MSAGHGPVFSRQRLGEELRTLRNQRGLTQVQLGAMAGCSGARISRLETAETVPDLALVMNVLDAMSIDEDAQKRLIMLARDANEQTWWRVSGMPARQAAFAEMEASAQNIAEYSMVFVPGLLQTPEYVQVRYADHEATIPVDETAAVQGRQQRQGILTQETKPVSYKVILDEAVLRRQTAPSDVLQGQRDYLIEVAKLSNVDLRVLRFDARIDYWAPPLTSFAVYDMAGAPQVVVVENETNEVQLGDADEISRYAALFDRIHRASLDPGESMKFIEGVKT